jgi:hypothetical protein
MACFDPWCRAWHFSSLAPLIGEKINDYVTRSAFDAEGV